MLLQAAMLLSLPLLGASVLLLALGGCWVGFQFGGNLSLFPLLTAERFGLRHLGANYGLVFTAYGVGGVVGPLLAGSVWDALGSYRWAFWAAAAASLTASALIVSIRRDPLDVRGTEPPEPPPGAWRRPEAEAVGAGRA
jgi:OFA family oxalate/formate antiporter-like MFS transporter